LLEKMPEEQFITPDWPAPSNVRAAVTTRIGGQSRAPYDSFNLASHVGDDTRAVAANRELLRERLGLPSDPVWLRQVHGVTVVNAASAHGEPEADGALAVTAGTVCAVLTADCLPVLLCDTHGTRVAALHAGWRGLAAGILEEGIKALGPPGDRLMAWLGPAIGPDVFEVGGEVRSAFVAHDPAASAAFRPRTNGKYLADLYRLARLRLAALGVGQIHGGEFCTYSDRERFYSFRRDGATGRMAALIWLAGP
jgi:YfiH family protein